MSVLKELWARTARFAKALEGIDDPTGNYMSSLERRIDRLEHNVGHLERQLGARAGDGVRQ